MRRTKSIFIWFVGIAAIVGILFLISANSKPGRLDEFARCLKDKGTVFYGAFWCPHCQKQKAMFGGSQKLLPYIECSTPSGKGQLAVCQEKKITGYPTWEFVDGSKEFGEVSLKKLAEKTNCPLPQ